MTERYPLSKQQSRRPGANGVAVQRCPMWEEREFGTAITGEQGVFDITSIESRWERWRQLEQLALGGAAIWLGYEIATWARDPDTVSVRVWTSVVVLFGLYHVGRAVSRFVVSVSSRQARVFRCRHLAVCGICLLAVVAALVSVLLDRGPLSSVLSHGSITGRDIADLGFVVAAGFCLVGAITAFVAAFAEFRSEHAWRHPRAPSPSG